MRSALTRRQFLQDTAYVSGGALLVGVDPAGAWATSDRPAAAGAPDRRGRSTGPSAQVEHGEGRGEFQIRWTRTGGSSSLELTTDSVRIDVPTRGVQDIDLDDFAAGRGQHDVLRHFGSAALDQLRNDLTTRRIFTS